MSKTSKVTYFLGYQSLVQMTQNFPVPVRSQRQYLKEAKWNKTMATFHSNTFITRKKDTGSVIPLDQYNPGEPTHTVYSLINSSDSSIKDTSTYRISHPKRKRNVCLKCINHSFQAHFQKREVRKNSLFLVHNMWDWISLVWQLSTESNLKTLGLIETSFAVTPLYVIIKMSNKEEHSILEVPPNKIQP